MRRWLLISILAAAFALFLAGAVVADNGPHQGDFTPTTDACAGCHRAHRGQTDKLLKKDSQPELCFSCHGTAAAGADTNVQDGVYQNRASGGQYGTVGAGLRGGGFTNVVMDPSMIGTPASGPVTSKHSVGEPGLTVWGLGGSGPGHVTTPPRPTLECSSCHMVHGFSGADYYRVLRADLPCLGCHTIHGSSLVQQYLQAPDDDTHSLAAALLQQIPDEDPKNYTITYFTSGNRAGYRDDSYLNSKGISNWCAACHTRYLAATADDSGDDIFGYRHVTSDDFRKCLACHVAHGTSATMGTNSGGVEWPDGTVGGGSSDSRLLHTNNRGVCYQCHPSP